MWPKGTGRLGQDDILAAMGQAIGRGLCTEPAVLSKSLRRLRFDDSFSEDCQAFAFFAFCCVAYYLLCLQLALLLLPSAAVEGPRAFCLHPPGGFRARLDGPPRPSQQIQAGKMRGWLSNHNNADKGEVLGLSSQGWVSVHAELGQESQASSCVEEFNSSCLSSCSRGDRP